jgi:hypothetical protein
MSFLTPARVALALMLSACTEGKDPAVDDTDETDDTDPGPTGWQTPATGLGSALLSITGSAADDVWTVGSNADGTGALVLQYDGAAWIRHDVGVDQDLWWVWENTPDDLWMVGAGGTVVHYTPSTATADVEVLDASLTLFGIWGSGPDDIWAVGGNTTLSTSGSQVWHYDGAAWSRADVPEEADALGSVFKVWGRATDDVWMVGRGLLMRWDGAAWTVTPAGTTTDLFTVNGTPEGPDVWACGGAGQGVILHWDGSAWSDESPDFAPTIPGIYAGGGSPVAAGHAGSVFGYDGGAWSVDARGTASFQDFHAAWQDPEGGVWAVGGSIRSFPLDEGTIVYGGSRTLPVYPP